MRKMNVTLGADFVNTKENVAGELTEFLEVEIPSGTRAQLERYTKVLMKLKDSDGNEIDKNSKIVFTVANARDNIGTEFDDFSYLPYYNTSIQEQQETERDDNFRFSYNENINLSGKKRLIGFIKSDDVVDVDNSTIHLPLRAK